METGSIVRWKQYLPANLSDLVGSDLATVIGRMKVNCAEDGVVTDYNPSSGRINVLFPEYGCEQYGLHVDCFVEEGQIDDSTPPVESTSWWQKILGRFS